MPSLLRVASDARTPPPCSVWQSSASLQKAILAKLGGELVSYLRDRLLPSLGCSAEFAAEYVRHVVEADVIQLRDFIRAQLVSARQ